MLVTILTLVVLLILLLTTAALMERVSRCKVKQNQDSGDTATSWDSSGSPSRTDTRLPKEHYPVSHSGADHGSHHGGFSDHGGFGGDFGGGHGH